MTTEDFRQQVFQLTLRAMDKQPNDWVTFNDILNTKLMDDIFLKNRVKLIYDELPILECQIANSYLVITTERVISILNNIYNEVYITDIDKFLNEYEKENYKMSDGKYLPINIVGIQRKDGVRIKFLIDSYHPAYFAKILIYNIRSYKTTGKWFINPK